MIKIISAELVLWGTLLLLFSCNSPKNSTETPGHKQIVSLVNEARSAASASPDRALVLCDSADALSRTYALVDTFDLAICRIRAKAVSNTGMPDSAFNILHRLYEQKKQWPDTGVLVRTLYDLGWYSYTGGNITTAEKYLDRTLGLMEQAHIERNRVSYMTVYADILIDRGKYTEAQDCLFKALRLAEAVKDTYSIALCYKGIGNVYSSCKNATDAINYYLSACEYFKSIKEQPMIVAVLTDIGLSYRKSRLDSALYFCNMALAADTGTGNIRTRVITLYNIGSIHAKMMNLDEARACYDQVIDICQKNNILHGLPKVYSGYATLENALGNTQKEAAYYTKAIDLSRQLGDNTTSIELMKSLLPVYKKTGEWEKYTRLSAEARVLEDSLMSTRNIIRLHDIAKSYDMEKKEMANQYLGMMLERENQMNRLWKSLLLLFVIAFLLTGILFTVNKRLKKGLESSYYILMEQYREERKQREKAEIKLFEVAQHTGSTRNLLDYFNNEKPYLNPDLKAADVMDTLSITYKELQDILSALNHPNFKSLLNHYRVQETVLRFEDPSFDHYTIEAIARDAGFGSKTRFYTIFESVKGVKPAFYRSQINLPARS